MQETAQTDGLSISLDSFECVRKQDREEMVGGGTLT